MADGRWKPDPNAADPIKPVVARPTLFRKGQAGDLDVDAFNNDMARLQHQVQRLIGILGLERLDADTISDLGPLGDLTVQSLTSLSFFEGLSLLITGAASITGNLGVQGDLDLDGSIAFGGDILYEDTFYDDLRFPAQGIDSGALTDPPTVDTSDPWMGTLLFTGSGPKNNQVAGVAQLPHSWKEGTDISPHIHWAPVDGNAGNVAWRFSYQWANINGVFPGSLTTAGIEVDAADGVADKHQIHGFTDIPMPGGLISAMIVWKLERVQLDASDTYGSDARLLELDFHYQIDTPGSDELFTK